MADHAYEGFLKRFLAEERLLRPYLLSATGDPDAADDLLQSTAHVLLTKWGEFDSARPFRPWVMGVARMEVLKWRQAIARSRETLSEESVIRLAEVAVDCASNLDSRYRFLLECLERLRVASRRLLEMKYGEGLKICHIAERLGKRVEAVQMGLVRVRRTLRDCIERKVRKTQWGTHCERPRTSC